MGRTRVQIIFSLSAAVVSWIIFQGCVVKEDSNDLQDEVAMVEMPVGSAFVQHHHRRRRWGNKITNAGRKVEHETEDQTRDDVGDVEEPLIYSPVVEDDIDVVGEEYIDHNGEVITDEIVVSR